VVALGVVRVAAARGVSVVFINKKKMLASTEIK
jgi:hypothetical protein